MRDFLWEYKDKDGNCSHLVKWNVVCAAKAKGGLGVLNLKRMNQALLAKWCWRWSIEKTHLWYQIIEEKYGRQRSLWIPTKITSAHGVSCWRTIAEMGKLISSNSKITIHSGMQVSFWHDIWVGNKTLAEEFKVLCKLDRSSLASVAQHMTADRSWYFDFKRPLLNEETNLLADLFMVIGTNPPELDALMDTRRWTLKSNGDFTVKSLYINIIATEGVDDFPWKFVWKVGIPPKVNLVWYAVHGKLNSLDMLNHKGMNLYSSCALCGDSPETQDHLLLHCRIATKIWSAVTPAHNWSWVLSASVLALSHTWSYNFGSITGNVVWDVIPAAVFWTLWRERDCRIFEDKYTYKTDGKLCDNAKHLILSWMVAAKHGVQAMFAYSICNWDTIFY